MPLALSSTDPLVSSLTYLIGVDDDNNIKFLKGGLTPIVGANVSIQTGAFGRAFRTGTARTVADLVSWVNTATSNSQNITVFVAYNQFNGTAVSSGVSAGMFTGRLDNTAMQLALGMQMNTATGKMVPACGTAALSQARFDTDGTTALMNTAGAHSIAWTMNGATAASVSAFVDGARDANYATPKSNAGSSFGGATATGVFEGIGGVKVSGSQWSSLSLDYVYVAIWIGTKVSDGDIARLHASLSGSNQFALIEPIAITADATFSVTTDDAVFSGGAEVIGAPASATFAVTTADTVFSGGAVVATSGTLVSDVLINNTGTVLASQAVYWSWLPSGRIGSLSAVTGVDGTGTTSAGGVLTVTGLTSGAGILLIAKRNTSAADDHVYYQAGTVA